MITLPVDRLRPGMIICQSIYDDNGLFLLRRGTKLTPFYIFKIQQAGIKEVTVISTNISTRFVLPNDIVCEATRIAAIKNLSNSLDELEKKGILLVDKLQSSIISIIKEIMKNKDNLVQMTDIRTHDSYTMVHSVNVAVLSSLIGVLYNLSYRDLEELTLGAMLHDIRKTSIPVEILNKSTTLSEDEFSFIRKHPVFSMQKLRKAGHFSNNIIDIAGQHHEKIDGTGYPYKLVDKQINFYAKIVAIADVYDALTSVRPYKKAYKPHIAYNIMMFHSQGQFDMKILKKFFDNVAIYPNGTILKTNMGTAIVKKSIYGKILAPIIYIFTDKSEKLLPKPILLNLSQNNYCYIERVYDDYEVLSLIEKLNFDPVTLLYLPDEQ
ncbi:HD-GYP domain-containing protein [Pectinatus sottacetonis]|uniref:HD-GYP domain-containing protein n=1 Tax=Pectinatus sottacetonis TaxID=1002795 RepID=UPI0018C4D4A1|nr:HD-GYP domain-containing protein [Pectinatus sottacetonis]